MKSTRKNVFYLLTTALIWGVAFVAQREGGEVLGPYMFTSLRFFLGAIVLLPVIRIMDHLGNDKKEKKANSDKEKNANNKNTHKMWIAGIICGTILSSFTILQQLGLYYGTTAGKAGFLTSCYIVLVPILGLFIKRKCKINVWIAVAITVVGLYLLCINESFGMQKGDIFILACSLLCAVHILVVDHVSVDIDGVRLSCIQFLVAGTVALIPTFLIDVQSGQVTNEYLEAAFTNRSLWIALLYTGICSSGIAYTFQILGQRNFNPTIASLLMSLESVFSVIAGAIILQERMGTREVIGCVLIFTAVVLAQIDFTSGKDTKKQ